MSTGLKQRELTACASCNRGMMHKRAITFFRVTAQRFMVNLNAVREQAGLEQFFGPVPGLAAIVGPDKDMAVPVGDGDTFLLCDECAMMKPLSEIIEDKN